MRVYNLSHITDAIRECLKCNPYKTLTSDEVFGWISQRYSYSRNTFNVFFSGWSEESFWKDFGVFHSGRGWKRFEPVSDWKEYWTKRISKKIEEHWKHFKWALNYYSTHSDYTDDKKNYWKSFSKENFLNKLSELQKSAKFVEVKIKYCGIVKPHLEIS